MDYLDLLRIWEQSPPWFKVYIVVFQLAALYGGFTSVHRVSTWMVEICGKFGRWLRLEERWIWFRYRPSVSLKIKPSLNTTGIDGTPRKKYSCVIKFEFLRNDEKRTEISLEDLSMELWQGWGKRRIRVKLEPTNKTYSNLSFSIDRNKSEKNVEMQGFGNTEIPRRPLKKPLFGER